MINPPWIFPLMYKMASTIVDDKTKKKITVIYGTTSLLRVASYSAFLHPD